MVFCLRLMYPRTPIPSPIHRDDDKSEPHEPPARSTAAHVQPISLAGAADGLSVRLPAGADHLQIVDVYLDSRSVLPGSLYVGLPGTRTHGANFAAQAAALGAVAC